MLRKLRKKKSTYSIVIIEVNSRVLFMQTFGTKCHFHKTQGRLV